MPSSASSARRLTSRSAWSRSVRNSTMPWGVSPLPASNGTDAAVRISWERRPQAPAAVGVRAANALSAAGSSLAAARATWCSSQWRYGSSSGTPASAGRVPTASDKARRPSRTVASASSDSALRSRASRVRRIGEEPQGGVAVVVVEHLAEPGQRARLVEQRPQRRRDRARRSRRREPPGRCERATPSASVARAVAASANEEREIPADACRG